MPLGPSKCSFKCIKVNNQNYLKIGLLDFKKFGGLSMAKPHNEQINYRFFSMLQNEINVRQAIFVHFNEDGAILKIPL